MVETDKFTNFENEMMKAKQNLKTIAAISGTLAVGPLTQFDGDDIHSFVKPNGGLWEAETLKEEVFIHLYKLAIDTLILLSNYEKLLGKTNPEKSPTIIT